MRKIKEIVSLFKRWKWYIKDYERLEYDYSCTLCHATLGRMSKSGYDLKDIYSEIDNAQEKFHYDIIKSDINDIIKEGGTIEDVKEYVNGL